MNSEIVKYSNFVTDAFTALWHSILLVGLQCVLPITGMILPNIVVTLLIGLLPLILVFWLARLRKNMFGRHKVYFVFTLLFTVAFDCVFMNLESFIGIR